MRTVLVTGANGFVGVPLCRCLERSGYQVLGGVRNEEAAGKLPAGVARRRIPDVMEDVDWTPTLRGVDAVVHLVARTHVMRDRASDPLEEYRRVNVEGVRRVICGAREAGVKQFIFMSSIKAVGEGAATAYTESSPLRPEDAYGVSKAEAEAEVLRLTENTATGAVIVRPPLIYGADVRGNLQRLSHWMRRGLPLPLASVKNARSLVYVENLADAVAHILASGAEREVFHVADRDPLSTPQLLRRLAAAHGRRARLFPFPPRLLRWIGAASGRQSEFDRLLGSLTVSTEKIRKQLGWTPPNSVEQGMREMALGRNAKEPPKPSSQRDALNKAA